MTAQKMNSKFARRESLAASSVVTNEDRNEKRYISGEPLDSDVCCGRGKGYFCHPGNKVFQDMVRDNLGTYEMAKSKNAKSSIVADIVKELFQRGVRFVKQDSGKSGNWYILPKSVIHEKTGHAIRDILSHQRRQKSGDEVKPVKTKKVKESKTVKKASKQIKHKIVKKKTKARQLATTLERVYATFTSSLTADDFDTIVSLSTEGEPTDLFEDFDESLLLQEDLASSSVGDENICLIPLSPDVDARPCSPQIDEPMASSQFFSDNLMDPLKPDFTSGLEDLQQSALPLPPKLESQESTFGLMPMFSQSSTTFDFPGIPSVSPPAEEWLQI